MAGTPAAMRYYSAKEILTAEGFLKKCPACSNTNPIEWDKKSKKDDPTSKYFSWQCTECGFQTIASTKPNTQFTLKSCLVDNVAAKLEWEEAEEYFKGLGLKVTRAELAKAYTKSQREELIPEAQGTPKRKREQVEEGEDSSPNKKIKLSDSQDNKLTEIAEYVKVIKEVTEVQKDELKKMLIAITSLSTTTMETMIKVTELLQENNDKLSVMSNNNSAPPSIPHITEEELLSCFNDDNNEICGTMDFIEEEEIIKPTPPPPSKPVTAPRTPKKTSSQQKKISK